MITQRSYRFIQLDVFTDRPFAGEIRWPFSLETEGLTSQEMQQIALEVESLRNRFRDAVGSSFEAFAHLYADA
ncbi:MAG: hypothetical protein WKF84_22590 [Pyrinomonadaceae bacterium]